MSDRKFLPHHSKIVILTEGVNEDRSRSTRLGLICAMLNLPRMLFQGVFRFLKVMLVFLFTAVMVFIMEVIFHPFYTFYAAIALGRSGLLADAAEVEGDEAGKPIVMFDRGYFDEVSTVMRGREIE